MPEVLLRVEGLSTGFVGDHGFARAVEGVSFMVTRGKTLGIVGESGSGKSVTSLSLMRLLPKPAGVIEKGQVWFDGKDLLQLPVEDLRRVRGRRIAMIFQEPMTALNPVQRVGDQLMEIFELHTPELDGTARRQRAIELFEKVGIPSPARRMNEYPHHLSGGMRQRVMIAMALACKPDVLIADEPTTALDVTIQAQILELMRDLQKREAMGIIFITHDLGVVAEMCDDVIVMYAGQVVEQASVQALFGAPKHPYTRGLLGAIPTLETPRRSRLQTIEGLAPNLLEMPSGCRFQDRCSYVQDACRSAPVHLLEHESGSVRCIRWREISA